MNHYTRCFFINIRCTLHNTYESRFDVGTKDVSDEDGRRDEDHAADGHNAKNVPIVIGCLVVLTAKVQIIAAQKHHTNDRKKLPKPT